MQMPSVLRDDILHGAAVHAQGSKKSTLQMYYQVKQYIREGGDQIQMIYMDTKHIHTQGL